MACMALLALLLLLGTPPAHATKVGYGAVPCPLDGTAAKVYELLSSNTHGGYDSDLCRYSTQGQWREHAITTCPRDLYTVYGTDFDLVHDEATTQKLVALAGQIRAEHPDPDALEPWDRYAIAARFYELLGKDQAFIGELYLKASWLARDRAVGVYVGLEGPSAAAEALRLGAEELQKELPPPDRTKVLYNLARVAHRAGEGTQRDALLVQLETQESLGEAEREAIARMRQMAHDVEPRFQDLAIVAFTEWLRGEGLPPDRMIRITYLTADLLRRRGRIREAVAYYSMVAGNDLAPQQLREMALFLAAGIVEEARAQDDI